MRESKIEGELRKQVTLLGGWMEKHVSPGHRGAPDNVVMWPLVAATPRWWIPDGAIPHIEFVETKAPTGKLEVLQKRDHERRRKMGFTVHVIWNMDQVEAYLRSRGKR